MNILNKLFKSKYENDHIFKEWELNLKYLQSLKPDHSVVTHILLDDKKEQYLLIYQDNNVLFMSKSIETPLHVVFSTIHKDMIKNEKLWECIKSSKELGKVLPNDTLVQFIVEKMENNAGYCGVKMEDELKFWRHFSLFSQNMKTSPIVLPEYKENENIWVD